jgi:hypothetical protein
VDLFSFGSAVLFSPLWVQEHGGNVGSGVNVVVPVIVTTNQRLDFHKISVKLFP